MATMAAGVEGRDVSIGRIFNQAFGTIGSSPVATLGIAFLFGALPATIVGYGAQRLQVDGLKLFGGLPLFLLGLVSAIGIGIGFILLIVPGIILYVMLSVAAPALVEERLGVLDALSRSHDLTAGARWKIFGLELIALVIYWMFSALVGVLTLTMLGGVQGMTVAAVGGFPLSYYAVTAVASTLTTAVRGVIHTSLYVELRDWKDGPPTDALADVFG